jgi:hypothetical protein
MSATGTLPPSAIGFAALVALGVSPVRAAPQMPLAAGTYAQLGLVMEAAHKCGFRSFRVEEGYLYQYLYSNDNLGSYPCLQSWLKKSARDIGLAPRGEGDTYER